MDAQQIKIEAGWRTALTPIFESEAFDGLAGRLRTEKQAGKVIFPPGESIFAAFNRTPWEAVRVVLLGQDPYHRRGQAMGLSFSVPRGVRVPPSLVNIYKEIVTDVGGQVPSHGDLSQWADQGVLLLNAMLTVEEGRAGSHQKLGWQAFTDGVIQTISEQKEGVVFLLWGNFAKSKAALIDQQKHHVLQAAHPSPLARGAFFGSKHFSQTNALLEAQGSPPIQWQIDE